MPSWLIPLVVSVALAAAISRWLGLRGWALASGVMGGTVLVFGLIVTSYTAVQMLSGGCRGDFCAPPRPPWPRVRY